MAKPWCSSPSDGVRHRRRAGLVCLAAAVVVLGGVLGTQAAVIRDRQVRVEVSGGAAVLDEQIEVEITGVADRADWSTYAVLLDDDIQLESIEAEVLDAEGKLLERIPRRRHQRIDSIGFGLYDSRYLHVVPFPPVQPGQLLRVHYRTRERPLYPALAVPVVMSEPQTHLEITVTGATGCRWHLDADRAGVTTSTSRDGVLTVHGEDVPRSEDIGGPAAARRTTLRLALNPAGAWRDVGGWYTEAVAPVIAPDETVVTRARALVGGADTPRDRVAALARFVKRQIRYEAVEVGPGGWVPSRPSEVLERGWGDCKDKAALLHALLAALGIDSHLVLLRAGHDGWVDEELAAPLDFNHCILAVDAAPGGAHDGDPVVDGELIVDATAERGGLAWLPPGDQGRSALLCDGARSRLVQLPVRSATELSSLTIDGTVYTDGGMGGSVRVLFRGRRAAAWLEDLVQEQPQVTDGDLRSLVARVVPGAILDNLTWKDLSGELPEIELDAHIRVAGLVRGESGGRWLRAGALRAFPSGADAGGGLAQLTPGLVATEWHLVLPTGWCPPVPADEEATEPLGTVTRSTWFSDGALDVRQRAEVRRLSAEGDEELAMLTRLAAAERRGRRRVRLRCAETTVEARPGGS